ncbi:CCAAT/enhancer-binding protein zeta [Hetaerina americana]|uniref:CCAAT/enhancer-binding protein zeta n=1 Tax=Hetaerina americana TaxID=62018 RepID=UPI003A7F50B5
MKISKRENNLQSKKKTSKQFASKKSENPDAINITCGQKWYETEVPQDPQDFPSVSRDVVNKLKNEAKTAMEMECVKHKEKMSSKPDYKWMSTIMSKGTSSDKIASYTVAIQDSPLQSLPLLQNLVGMVKMGKRKDCFTVIDTLAELFLEDLIPKKWEKLRQFSQRPHALLESFSNGKPSLRRKILLSWLFEDELKRIFSDFVAAVCEVAAKDSIEKNRMQAIAALHNLLNGTSEKEDVILTSLVNKLGDPNLKVASKVVYCLKQLLQKHPNMQEVVKEEIEKLIFRQNISSKAQFYGLCFLNQYYLTSDDQELARSLIKLYFSFFKACIKKGELDCKIMSAVLTGVKRAYPFANLKMDDEALADHMQTVHKIVHLGSFNISVHALSLLLQVMDFSSDAISDRYYTALYKKIIDPQLASSNLQAMFISMCFKAIKNDSEMNRKKAFVKRFLQVCLYVPVPLACGILYMISEILRNDHDPQLLMFHGSSGVNEDKPDKVVQVLDEDDDYEHYEDIKLEEDAENVEVKNEELSVHHVKEEPCETAEPSWVHRPKHFSSERVTMKKLTSGYDPNQRNPRFSLTSGCTYTELVRLSRHFHPTVALFAQKISKGEHIEYSGDPLIDFGLLRFLNRFAFKNPKKASQVFNEEGTPANVFSRKNTYIPKGLKSLPVTSGSYLSEKEENIPVDERFLYNYIHQRRHNKVAVKEKEDSDNDSVNSEEFEEVMHKFLGGKSKMDMEDEDDLDFADGVNFDDGDEEGQDVESNSRTKMNRKIKTKKRKAIEFESANSSDSEESDAEGGDDMSKMFASAEEFSEMLQDTGSSQLNHAGSSGMSNKDNAALKQLRWEEARDKWVKGVDRHVKRSGGGMYGKKHKLPRKKTKLRRK